MSHTNVIDRELLCRTGSSQHGDTSSDRKADSDRHANSAIFVFLGEVRFMARTEQTILTSQQDITVRKGFGTVGNYVLFKGRFVQGH